MTRQGWSQLAVAIGLAGITLLVFWPVTSCDFINFDDPSFVTSNTHVLGGLTRDGVLWAFQLGQKDYWHPLTWLSLMLDVTLFGRGATGLHLTNLLLHVANTVLLFIVLGRLTGALWRSALVAGLFALHPLHVESVAWVTERKDVLSTLFWLLTLWAYGRCVKGVMSDKWRVTKGKAITSSVVSPVTRHSSLFYGLALLFFGLGLMSKPMLVTLPFVMLLLDYWPLRRFEMFPFRSCLSPLWRLVREKIPFFALSGISCGVTFWEQRKGGALATLADLSVAGRLENVFVVYARYLEKTFWPAGLAVYYPNPGHWPPAEVVLAGVLVVGLCLGALWVGRNRPYAFVGWFWFWGTLVPVIGLIQTGNQFMADRFTYVPLIGVFIVLVWGASEVRVRWRLPGALAGVAAGLVVVACAMRTRNQLRYWHDNESLFRHALVVTKDNYLAYNTLGIGLRIEGRTDEAIEDFRKALEIRPNYAEAHFNLGSVLGVKGLIEEAIYHYRKAVQLKPDYAEAHNNLGNALARQGRVEEAVEQYIEALKLTPEDGEVHNGLGSALASKGQVDEAIRQFREALRLAPNNARVWNNLGNALRLKGRVGEALEQYRQALRINPHDVEAQVNLANVLAETGQVAEAMDHYRQALLINPNHAGAHLNLGITLAGQGRFDEAMGQFTEVLRINPNYPEAHLHLGRVLAQAGRREEAIAQLTEALRLKPEYPPAREALRALGAPTPE